MAVTGERRQVNSTYYFVVEIGNERSSYFRSVGGLKSEAEVVPMQEGGRNDTELRLIGRTKFPNLVLKQGFADSKLSATLLKAASGGRKPTRYDKAISIAQLGPGGKTIAKWYLIEAWVCKWEGPEFDATKNEISIETIEIAHHGIEVG